LVTTIAMASTLALVPRGRSQEARERPRRRVRANRRRKQSGSDNGNDCAQLTTHEAPLFDPLGGSLAKIDVPENAPRIQ
jgi:hypothetical protein